MTTFLTFTKFIGDNKIYFGHRKLDINTESV